MDDRTLEFFSRSAEQTRRLGLRLGRLMQKGDLICLSGDLGSGKTTLTQGIAQGWGSTDAVTSPTFVLINEYHRPDGVNLNHLDAYRLSGSLEAIDLDLEILQETGALIVEWPERIKDALPADYMWLDMRWMADEQRGLTFHAHGKHYEEMLAQFRRQLFGG